MENRKPIAKVKHLFRRVMPGLYGRLEEWWTDHKIKNMTSSIVGRHGLIVQAGPFAGMRFVAQATGRSLLPKLIGSYEAELHQALVEVMKGDYELVINVGCAEGYYAVGLALQLPRARVYAFDIDTRAQQICEETARANGVAERVIVGGECDLKRLHELTQQRALIVCDCEGCEFDLLRPDLLPQIGNSDLLVELHDLIDRRISPTIVSRFSPTHEISLLSSTARDPSRYPALQDFGAWEQRVAVAEFRDEAMQWAFMKSRKSPA